MKKSILNLGEVLNKSQQKNINGSRGFYRCSSSSQCGGLFDCCSHGSCIDTTHAVLQPFCS